MDLMLFTKQIQFPREVNEKFTPSLGMKTEDRKAFLGEIWAVFG